MNYRIATAKPLAQLSMAIICTLHHMTNPSEPDSSNPAMKVHTSYTISDTDIHPHNGVPCHPLDAASTRTKTVKRRGDNTTLVLQLEVQTNKRGLIQHRGKVHGMYGSTSKDDDLSTYITGRKGYGGGNIDDSMLASYDMPDSSRVHNIRTYGHSIDAIKNGTNTNGSKSITISGSSDGTRIMMTCDSGSSTISSDNSSITGVNSVPLVTSIVIVTRNIVLSTIVRIKTYAHQHHTTSTTNFNNNNNNNNSNSKCSTIGYEYGEQWR